MSAFANARIITGGSWKRVELNKNLLKKIDSEGLTCIEELQNYKVKKQKRTRNDVSGDLPGKEPKQKKRKGGAKSEAASASIALSKGGVKQKKESGGPQKKESGGSQKADEVNTIVKSSGSAKQKRRKKKKRGKPSAADKAEDEVEEKLSGAENPDTTQDNPTVDMSAWLNLHVPVPVLSALTRLGFDSPTPVQTLALPAAISHRQDVVAAAQTGSGKTLAFGIPMLNGILNIRAATAQSEAEADEAAEEGDGDVEEEQEEQSEEEDEVASDTSDEEREDAPGGSQEEEEEEEADSDEEGDVEGAEDDEDAEDDGDSEDEGLEASDTSDDDGQDDVEEDQGEDLTSRVNLDAIRSQMAAELGHLDDDSDVDRPPGESDLEDMAEEEGEEEQAEETEEDPPTQQGKKRRGGDQLLGLVLTPTRELAVQVCKHLAAAASETDIQVVPVIGGMSQQKQERLLKRRPEIVVATPGRLWELIQTGEPHLNTLSGVRFLAVDEADRMVEKGHFEELKQILGLLNIDEESKKRRQTFVFSATLLFTHTAPSRKPTKRKHKLKQLTVEDKLASLVETIGVRARPKIIDLTAKRGTAETLIETRVMCTLEEKDRYLYYILHVHRGRTLVFANSKDCVRRLIGVLTVLKLHPLPLHADMHQKQRLKNLEKFTSSPHSVMIATDVAARGLDIPLVQHVIHYQVPRTSENYVHRSGRTARANREGVSVMLVGPDDMAAYKNIVKNLNRAEDLGSFPVEGQYMRGVKARVGLGRRLDKLQHGMLRQKRNSDWFIKAARDMDVDLDEEHFGHDSGDEREERKLKWRLGKMGQELEALLREPLVPRTFSPRFITSSGSLVTPLLPKQGASALEALKAQQSTQKKAPKHKKRKQKKKTSSKD